MFGDHEEDGRQIWKDSEPQKTTLIRDDQQLPAAAHRDHGGDGGGEEDEDRDAPSFQSRSPNVGGIHCPSDDNESTSDPPFLLIRPERV